MGSGTYIATSQPSLPQALRASRAPAAEPVCAGEIRLAAVTFPDSSREFMYQPTPRYQEEASSSSRSDSLTHARISYWNLSIELPRLGTLVETRPLGQRAHRRVGRLHGSISDRLSIVADGSPDTQTVRTHQGIPLVITHGIETIQMIKLKKPITIHVQPIMHPSRSNQFDGLRPV